MEQTRFFNGKKKHIFHNNTLLSFSQFALEYGIWENSTTALQYHQLRSSLQFAINFKSLNIEQSPLTLGLLNVSNKKKNTVKNL